MRTITLKSIPDTVYKDLKEKAKANQRSINGEVLFALQLYLKKRELSPEEIISRAQKLRSKIKGYLTMDEIQSAIIEGRE